MASLEGKSWKFHPKKPGSPSEFFVSLTLKYISSQGLSPLGKFLLCNNILYCVGRGFLQVDKNTRVHLLKWSLVHLLYIQVSIGLILFKPYPQDPLTILSSSPKSYIKNTYSELIIWTETGSNFKNRGTYGLSVTSHPGCKIAQEVLMGL